MTPTRALLAAVAAGLIAGWPTYRVADAPAALRPAIQRGDLAIISVQSAILRELHAALAEGGPEHALSSCHVDAAGVALQIRQLEGVLVGRTSARLRNPRNAPPAWAADIVARQSGAKARDVEGFVVDLGDRVGLLRPIAAQPMCASCHGPADRISPTVKAKIAARYPGDRATGFADGDLRGWFWVELPGHGGTK